MELSIETLARDEFFKLKETSKKVYLTKGYCRINKAYEAVNWDDISDSIYLKKGKKVFIGFEF
jgi:hypothetical protein